MLAVTRHPEIIKEFETAIQAVKTGKAPVLLSGAGEIHKAHLTAAVYRETKRPVVLVCADEAEANRLGRDISAFTGETAIHILTGRAFTFYSAVGVSRQVEQRRIGVLYAMARRQAPIVIATAEALMQRCIPPEVLLGAADTLIAGETRNLHTLVDTLIRTGYTRCNQVEGPGQFALRGGILDVFSPAQENPIRCEFWGDEIDSMGLFDPVTQRRTEEIRQAVLFPTAETLPALHPDGQAGLCDELKGLLTRLKRRKDPPETEIIQLERDIAQLDDDLGLSSADKYMALIYPDFTAPADYFPHDCTILFSELGKLTEWGRDHLAHHRADMKELLESGAMEKRLAVFLTPWPEVFARVTTHPTVVMDQFAGKTYGLDFAPKTLVSLLAKQLPSYGGSLETAKGDIEHYIRADYRTIVLCGERRRAQHMAQWLEEAHFPVQLEFAAKDLPEPGTCMVTLGSLSAGMEYPVAKLAVITEGQILSAAQSEAKSRPKKRRGRKIESFTDLSPGDLVVHEHHGIGRFVGILPMDIDGVKKDYIKIAYHGTDSLYVPVTQLDLVSKYIGADGEDRPVRLSKMGGAEWTRVRQKAKGAAKDLAKGLIQLYAERQRQTGFAFSPDSAWQREFEEAFDYTETEDQLASAQEIKQDMMKAVPMDRLLCGDVGYGKTEVAFRAVMKCILDGKQAAILVPTTVLAQQHYSTAIRRFAGYPVKIETLSRFQTPAEAKRILAEVAQGRVDLVIGTHKIIQKSVQFKDLGLLIVDEEQRFGVSHKERLKEMSKNVDVLTLSATPIPRTLNMALSGIRDMSTIEEPPQNRRPVQTYVMEHDWGVIADAIRKEISRGGQVYYLHNRVESIERVAARVRELSGGARVTVAHGRMDERHLGRAMEHMVSGESQILVCTTIIETGMDIPNVNTLIIENADRMGLAQLHQIRGRVGRSSRPAFAYLTYKPDKALTEIATKRLSAIREFAEFNSGFKIALRDLEIRGAGNILGREQSGHMVSVGYDMYLKLLNEAVLEEKGEAPPVRTECAADLSVDANIPADYVPMPEQRMDLYRRIAYIRTQADAEDVTDELIDRYGEPPDSVLTLIQVALLRGLATRAGISEISQKGGQLHVSFSEFSLERISAIYQLPGFQGRIKILAGETPAIRMKLTGDAPVIDQATAFVRVYGEEFS